MTIPCFGISIFITGKGVLMRNLLAAMAFALLLCAAATAGDIRLEDSNFSTVGYIRDNGQIENASFQTIGFIREDGRIEDDSFHTLGYIDEEGNIEDADYNDLFSVNESGRLTDIDFRKVAEIQSDGTVENARFQVILYADGTHDQMLDRIAIFLVFFSDILEASD